MLNKIVFFAALLLSAKSFAYPYGMAGCGLGALVFQDQPGKIQIVAATVNNLVSPQTSAITSGTSGCLETHGYNANLRYIETNRAALQDDVVRGSGETLDGLVTLLGCEQQQSVKSALKSGYSDVFVNGAAPQILEAIKSDSNLKQYCSRLG
ncbi:MAG: DUF3015 family protein [Bdellovibrio sp.]|nr:DUF3015 family protein [Bdellovibrio sp.]